MFSRSPLDWGLLVLYFGFLIALWLRPAVRRSAAAEYLVAGRRVTLPAFVATLVATWYGGILGVGEYSWRYGISNWLVFGAPYYIGALLFALVIARRARAAELLTLPDLLHRHYGKAPAIAGAVVVFITAAPAAYVLMLGTLFAHMFGVPLAPCVAAAALFSVFYIHRGGMRNAVLADQVYFVLMYTSFALLLAFLVARHGGFEFFHARLPATHFTWHGGNPAPAILVWYFIALSALVDPSFWQATSAARDGRVARRGVLLSIGFWILFDAMTTFTGLYARALLPNLANPVFSFPELARITLPPLALGFFHLGLIATVMSTIDSYGFIAANTLGRDIVWRLRDGTNEENAFRHARAGLWVAAAFAAVLALARPSVIALWHDLGSITTPALLLPVGTALLQRGRLTAGWTLAAMVVPFALALGWVLARDESGPATRYLWSIEPIYVGLVASLLIYALGWMAGSRLQAAAPASTLLPGGEGG